MSPNVQQLLTYDQWVAGQEAWHRQQDLDRQQAAYEHAKAIEARAAAWERADRRREIAVRALATLAGVCFVVVFVVETYFGLHNEQGPVWMLNVSFVALMFGGPAGVLAFGLEYGDL